MDLNKNRPNSYLGRFQYSNHETFPIFGSPTVILTGRFGVARQGHYRQDYECVLQI